MFKKISPMLIATSLVISLLCVVYFINSDFINLGQATIYAGDVEADVVDASEIREHAASLVYYGFLHEVVFCKLENTISVFGFYGELIELYEQQTEASFWALLEANIVALNQWGFGESTLLLDRRNIIDTTFDACGMRIVMLDEDGISTTISFDETKFVTPQFVTPHIRVDKGRLYRFEVLQRAFHHLSRFYTVSEYDDYGNLLIKVLVDDSFFENFINELHAPISVLVPDTFFKNIDNGPDVLSMELREYGISLADFRPLAIVFCNLENTISVFNQDGELVEFYVQQDEAAFWALLETNSIAAEHALSGNWDFFLSRNATLFDYDAMTVTLLDSEGISTVISFDETMFDLPHLTFAEAIDYRHDVLLSAVEDLSNFTTLTEYDEYGNSVIRVLVEDSFFENFISGSRYEEFGYQAIMPFAQQIVFNGQFYILRYVSMPSSTNGMGNRVGGTNFRPPQAREVYKVLNPAVVGNILVVHISNETATSSQTFRTARNVRFRVDSTVHRPTYFTRVSTTNPSHWAHVTLLFQVSQGIIFP